MIDVTPIPPSPPSKPVRTSRSRLIPGLLLMLFGVYLLAQNLGFDIRFPIVDIVPFILIGLGIVGLSFPTRHLNRAGGVWILGVGLYLACGLFHLFGLSWHSAWPIFIIGAGLAVILHRDEDVRHCRRVLHGA